MGVEEFPLRTPRCPWSSSGTEFLWGKSGSTNRMIVEEYLERFSPSVRPRTRMTEIEGEAKEFAGKMKVFEGEEV